MEINGKTEVYGLIGNPVGHSFSPLIHNMLAEGTGQNLVYTTFPVEDPESIGDAVRGALALGIRGMNVTVPYKSAVIPCLTEIDPVARAIGAVNTLVRIRDDNGNDLQPCGFKGYNTDYLGLFQALTEMGISLDQRSVILIGAGGAARAAGFMCGSKGVKKLAILNRTAEKAEHLAADLRREFADMEILTRPLEDAAGEAEKLQESGKVLAIQCTNVGLAPQADRTPVEDPAFFRAVDEVYDCIYNPEETRFLALAKEAGKPGRNGMDMLLWQGIIAYGFWTGAAVDDALTGRVREALYHFIQGKK